MPRRSRPSVELHGDRRAGLPRGFCPFGTLAHRVLLVLRHGDAMLADLRRELPDDSTGAIAKTLTTLRKHRFIYLVNTICKYDSGEDKTQALYSLQYHRTPPTYVKRTANERRKVWRARKRGRVNSIFNLAAHNAAVSHGRQSGVE